ncbi:MAG: type II secretion system protein, partial [Pseudomonadota bacterium]
TAVHPTARFIRSGDMRRRVQRFHSRGFTYLTALFIIVIMGVGFALLGELWHTASLRDKEAELLYVGNQYRRAIEQYYSIVPNQYPRTFQDLLKDPRAPNVRRHLRQLYPDPLTGAEWMLVKAPDGGIMGVYSRSEERPLKIANFSLRDRSFGGAAKYSDWKFVPTQPAATAKPAVPAPGAAGAPPFTTPAAPTAPR